MPKIVPNPKISSKHSSSNVRKKPYKYRRLLTHLQCCTKLPLSYNEQAQIVGCTPFFAKKITKENIANKIITKKSTVYKCNGREFPEICGKNIYGRGKNFDPKEHLIDDLELVIKTELNPKTKKKKLTREFKPRKNLNSNQSKKFTTDLNTKKNSSKEELAKGKPRKFSEKSSEKRKKSKEKHNSTKKYLSKEEWLKHKTDILKPFGFEKWVKKAPAWWFRDLKRLHSALKLLIYKLRRGWKCRDPFKFICWLLKHGTFGYRRHCARDLSLAVVKPTVDRVMPFCEKSEPIRQTYEGLKKLYKSHGLKMDFTSIEKLLRKKFPHLTAAVEVCFQRLKFTKGDPIRNINGFLNYLVGMDEPYNYLKRKETQC